MPDPTIPEIQAEIDRLNAQLESRQASQASTVVSDPPSGSAEASAISQAESVGPTPGDPLQAAVDSPAPTGDSVKAGATVIGAASDKRGGFVIGYSDGTVTLVNVPEQNGEAAQPWGNAPEGQGYTHFFIDEGGERYNFVTSNNTIESVEAPSRVFPPA